MRQREIHLVVPCFIDGSKMFRCLLNKWNEDQAHEPMEAVSIGPPKSCAENSRVLHVVLNNNVMDRVDQEDGHKCDHRDCNGKCKDCLAESQLLFVQIPTSVGILVVVRSERCLH